MSDQIVWERVDGRVLRWVASLPPSFTTNEIIELPVHPPIPFDEIPGLDTGEVAAGLRRLVDAGFVAGRGEQMDMLWWDLRLAPRGLVYLGEWPDLELVASAATLHRLLRAVAAEAPRDERDALVRSAGVLGRTVDAVIRDTLSEVAHATGEDIVT